MDLRLHCPGCEEELDIPTESTGQLVRCPYCNTDFFASTDHSHLEIVDDTPPPARELLPEDAFDKNRIALLVALRLGAIRTRSWWIIGFGISLMTTVDALRRAALYVDVLHHWGFWPTLDVIIAALGIRLAIFCRRRASELKLEIDQSRILEPTAPPDFSTLSDGSDRWKDLENVR